jgi:hypothetical protein
MAYLGTCFWIASQSSLKVPASSICETVGTDRRAVRDADSERDDNINLKGLCKRSRKLCTLQPSSDVPTTMHLNYLLSFIFPVLSLSRWIDQCPTLSVLLAVSLLLFSGIFHFDSIAGREGITSCR